MTYVYRAVDKIPKQLEPGVVYHNEDFELAELLCACGCGHRITLLVPDGHRLTAAENIPSVTPSILVADARCHSHFYITNGEVDWWEAYTPEMAAAVMSRQVKRHVSKDLASRTRWERARRAIMKTLSRFRIFISI